jgi:hypothetical protein
MVRRAYRHLRHPRLRGHRWWGGLSRRLFERSLWKPCRHTVGGGLGVGLFFAMMPMPLQMLAAALVAMRLRVNIPSAMLACWVSNPFTEPFVRLSQERLGAWLHGVAGIPVPPLLKDVEWAFGDMTFNLGNFVLGFLSSGLVLGLAGYPLAHLVAALVPHYFARHSPRLRRSDAVPETTRQ